MAELHWLGHSSFLLESRQLKIYIDPFQLTKDEPKADFIFLTHSHYDHFSPKDLRKVSTNNTVFITSQDIQLEDIPHKEHIKLKPNESKRLESLIIQTVPAYNIDKKFHPKENDWIGFIIEWEHTRYYFAGDCDRIPEFEKLTEIDIAIVPISGTYVMTASEAAKAVCEDLKPQLAIPCHYGSIIGTDEDADEFFQLVLEKGYVAQILKKE